MKIREITLRREYVGIWVKWRNESNAEAKQVLREIMEKLLTEANKEKEK